MNEVNQMTLEVEFGQVYDLTEDQKELAYQDGYSAGEAEGEKTGYSKGYSAGETAGYTKGRAEGEAAGYESGYSAGKTDGYAEGEAAGQTAGYQSGYAAGKTDGTAEGYAAGKADEQDATDGVIDGSISGDYENPRVTEIKASRFNGCTALTSVSFAAVKTLATSVFNGDSALVSISFPLLETVGSYAFNNCVKLPEADFPKLKSIAAGGFYGTRVMTKFIIRSATVCTLADKSAFQSSAIANGTGYIYVPDDLVESYKAATNWSTYADQIRPLSELED